MIYLYMDSNYYIHMNYSDHKPTSRELSMGIIGSDLPNDATPEMLARVQELGSEMFKSTVRLGIVKLRKNK